MTDETQQLTGTEKAIREAIQEIEITPEMRQFVSARTGSVPDGGSPCYPFADLNRDTIKPENIVKVIRHKDQSITLVTVEGYHLRFWYWQ
jgi:hypothetical protein